VSIFDGYKPASGIDEMFAADGTLKPSYECIARYVGGMDANAYSSLQAQADLETLNNGITFTVYADNRGTERIFPFSLVPRIIQAAEWSKVSYGLAQRIKALNMFLADIYGDAKCVKDGVIPADLALGNTAYRQEMKVARPALGTYVHVAGLDLVRSEDGSFRALEDNLRTPSGVSYVIENRRTMRSVVPGMFPPDGVEIVDEYTDYLLDALISVRPENVSWDETKVVVLTPGHFNSAYFEHSFLSRQMGVELVEGPDLIVRDDVLYMRATTGLERVHVVYRRIDDNFLDPDVYRADSLLGVPGIMSAYAKGNVTICNAPGAGVADDKATYRYVPDLIRYYTEEDPVIENIPSYLARIDEDRQYILDNLRNLVTKPVDASGGYGVLIGPLATQAQLDARRHEIKDTPHRWMAQPLQRFSSVPTFNGSGFEARRADLRAFVVTGESSWVLPGGLTRVAPNAESFIVNSSQGGGSKDTWVLRNGREATGAG
jgi:uncharacterized circularly permuted ATP-grasp superfamily protein